MRFKVGQTRPRMVTQNHDQRYLSGMVTQNHDQRYQAWQYKIMTQENHMRIHYSFLLNLISEFSSFAASTTFKINLDYIIMTRKFKMFLFETRYWRIQSNSIYTYLLTHNNDGTEKKLDASWRQERDQSGIRKKYV